MLIVVKENKDLSRAYGLRDDRFDKFIEILEPPKRRDNYRVQGYLRTQFKPSLVDSIPGIQNCGREK